MRGKLGVIIGLVIMLFTFVATEATAATASAATIKEYAIVINLSGRQRMLTQKMSKEMLLVAKGIDADKNRASLKKTAALFDATLKGLIKGNTAMGLPATTNKSTLKVLGKVKGLWGGFSGIVNGVVGGGKVPVAKVAELNLPLLKMSNTAVRLYEKEAKKSIGMSAGVVINLAGKQRMLTQKMSKNMLLVALNHRVSHCKSELKQTALLFDRTLKGLLDGDADLGLPSTANPAIRAQLGKVASIWSDLKPVMMRVTDVDATGVSGSDLNKMAELNLPLLKEMNKAVQMFADEQK
jgi:hypothetical protein